jgi:AraC-like DNA-binding protein
MKPALLAMGYYTSPLGGAGSPHTIKTGRIFFELITRGAVYPPAGDLLQGAGAVFVHTPGQETVSRSAPDGHYECMTITFSLERVLRPELWPRMFRWPDTEVAVTFAHQMLHAFHHTNVDREILGDLAWSQLRFQLDGFRRREDQQDMPPRVSEVMAHIDNNLVNALDINELAEHVGLSPSHLHARFREFVGTTPHQYVIRRRMQTARHLLATSTTPIKAIAADIGYANTESFCRAFKQHFKTTAATYRRKYMIYR